MRSGICGICRVVFFALAGAFEVGDRTATQVPAGRIFGTCIQDHTGHLRMRALAS